MPLILYEYIYERAPSAYEKRSSSTTEEIYCSSTRALVYIQRWWQAKRASRERPSPEALKAGLYVWLIEKKRSGYRFFIYIFFAAVAWLLRLFYSDNCISLRSSNFHAKIFALRRRDSLDSQLKPSNSKRAFKRHQVPQQFTPARNRTTPPPLTYNVSWFLSHPQQYIYLRATPHTSGCCGSYTPGRHWLDATALASCFALTPRLVTFPSTAAAAASRNDTDLTRPSTTFILLSQPSEKLISAFSLALEKYNQACVRVARGLEPSSFGN